MTWVLEAVNAATIPKRFSTDKYVKFKFLLKKSQLSNVSTEECLTAPHWDKIWIKSEREIARSQLFKLESWQNHRMQYKQTCLLSCHTF